MTTNEQKINNIKLIERAKILNDDLIVVIQSLVKLAFKNTTKRTTVTIATLSTISTTMDYIKSSLDEIKY